jgi:Mg-chelatase subunit ChlD
MFSFRVPLPFLVALLLATLDTCYAQFPQTLRLEARNPGITTSATTRSGVRYTMTVAGTYSVWSSYTGVGVDGAYYYDIPELEFTLGRVPRPSAGGYTFPVWVGDTNFIPRTTLPLQNFLWQLSRQSGLRINGQPLANTGRSPIARYQTTINGNGRGIELQILDSTFNLAQNRMVDRSEDNSGGLTITIEEQPELNVCDVNTVCRNGRPIGLNIKASLLQYDSTQGRPINTLTDPARIALAVNNTFICPDSIVCNTRLNALAFSLVLDRSGSMAFPFGTSTQTRLQALQRSATTFLRNLRPFDQSQLITFSDTPTLVVSWTTNTVQVSSAIASITSRGATAFYDAALMALAECERQSIGNKAIILLTDGEDNSSQSSENDVITRARQLRIPLYTVGVSLDPGSEASLQRIARATNGRYLSANSPAELDSVFARINREAGSEECCTVYFRLPETLLITATQSSMTILARDMAGRMAQQTVTASLSNSCVSSVTSVRSDKNVVVQKSPVSMTIAPNPAQSSVTIGLNLTRQGIVSADIVSSAGQVVRTVAYQVYGIGEHLHSVALHDLPPGMYYLRTFFNGEQETAIPFVIQR